MEIIPGYKLKIDSKTEELLTSEPLGVLCKNCYYEGKASPYYNIHCKRMRHIPMKQKTILFLPNGLEHNDFLTLATDIIRLLTDDNIFNYKIIFRFHPSKQWEILTKYEQEDFIKRSFLNDNFLFFDNETDLHKQVKVTDLIIAGESTTFFEALIINPNTIHFKTKHALNHITPDKRIIIYDNIMSLYEYIKEVLNYGKN